MSRVDGREFLWQLRQIREWSSEILLRQVGESAKRNMALMEGADGHAELLFDLVSFRMLR